MENDLISRQAAINALGNAGLINYAATGSSNGLIHAMNVIKGLPTAQPTARWIPVSENLPKKEGYFFVTDEAAGMAETLIDKYIRCDDGEWVWLYSQNVIAWMPLPEAYEEEQDGLNG